MAAPRSWRKRRAFVVLLLVGIAVLTAASLQEGRAGAAATASATSSVDIDHFAFHPPTLRIGRGGRVAFTNSSNVTHTATRAGSFDTGRIKPGTTKVIRFTHAGTFLYHCAIHPFMKGKIVVK